ASLYHSGSFKKGAGRARFTMYSPHRYLLFSDRMDTPDTEGLMPWFQTHPLIFAVPDPGMTIHSIFAMHVVEVGQAKLPQRNFEVGFVGLKRIEVDRHQHKIAQVRRALAKVENVVVVGLVGLEPQVRLQCRIQSADAVQLRNLCIDVARTEI